MFKFRETASRICLGLFVISVLPTTARAEGPAPSNQPYIDSLISELPKDPNPPSTGNQDPYIQSIRKKLKNTPEHDSTGYTEELRKELPPKDGSEKYSEHLKTKLPPDRGSALEAYKKGQELKANKGSLETRSAFGFKLFASATRTYSAGAKQDIAYDQVYGGGWIPDFSIHYEWRPFTGDFIKKFGLYGSGGFSFTKAKGKLDYSGPGNQFGSDARTEFQFLALPVNVGLIYRMNLGVIYPYFAGGPAITGFIEQRNDKAKGNKGFALGYWFTGGVALGLDWLSPRSSWDQFESLGIKHSYLNIDYTYQQSLAGGLVEYTVDGVEVGFTFEL